MDTATVSLSPPDPKVTIPMVPERRYLWSLLAMLMSATIFEGYDITIFHLCTPDIARTFHLNDRAIGAIATAVRFGGILSIFVVTLADRYGFVLLLPQQQPATIRTGASTGSSPTTSSSLSAATKTASANCAAPAPLWPTCLKSPTCCRCARIPRN